MSDKSWSAAEGNREKKGGLHYTIGMLETIKVNNVIIVSLLNMINDDKAFSFGSYVSCISVCVCADVCTLPLRL